MSASEVLAKYENDDNNLVHSANGKCLSNSAIVRAMEEYAASRDSRQLSAVPSFKEASEWWIGHMKEDTDLNHEELELLAPMAAGVLIKFYKAMSKRGIAG